MIEFEFPEFYLVTEDYSENVEVFHHGVWNGPQNEETEAARIAGIKQSWANDEARREEHRVRLKMLRPTMPQGEPHQSGMTDQHRANLSKAGMGNQNARKKK